MRLRSGAYIGDNQEVSFHEPTLSEFVCRELDILMLLYLGLNDLLSLRASNTSWNAVCKQHIIITRPITIRTRPAVDAVLQVRQLIRVFGNRLKFIFTSQVHASLVDSDSYGNRFYESLVACLPVLEDCGYTEIQLRHAYLSNIHGVESCRFYNLPVSILERYPDIWFHMEHSTYDMRRCTLPENVSNPDDVYGI